MDFSSGDFRLNGFISAPQTGISGKDRQFFIVNGRPVKEKTMLAAFNNTFQNYLEKSRSPAGVLNISIPPDQIDVNIHPMKLEIRFLDSSRVYQFIKNAIESTMGQAARLPADMPPSAFPHAPDLIPGAMQKDAAESSVFIFNEPVSSLGDDFRVLGQYQNSYIVVEKNAELLIIDQHNARERVLFERLQAGYRNGNVASAGALFPLLLELSPAERQALDEKKLAFFKKSGFDIRLLSGAAVEIKSFPQFLAEADLKETVRAALQQPENDLPAEERMLAAMACRNAVKVNQRLQPEQQRALVKDLFACENPHFCPHRRPIIVTLTLADIEKQLKRR